jgi:ATP-dependent RNA helicase DOB1
MVFEKKFNPVIIFSFSKKEVEGLALSMKQFDLTSDEEKA